MHAAFLKHWDLILAKRICYTSPRKESEKDTKNRIYFPLSEDGEPSSRSSCGEVSANYMENNIAYGKATDDLCQVILYSHPT